MSHLLKAILEKYPEFKYDDQFEAYTSHLGDNFVWIPQDDESHSIIISWETKEGMTYESDITSIENMDKCVKDLGGVVPPQPDVVMMKGCGKPFEECVTPCTHREDHPYNKGCDPDGFTCCEHCVPLKEDKMNTCGTTAEECSQQVMGKSCKGCPLEPKEVTVPREEVKQLLRNIVYEIAMGNEDAALEMINIYMHRYE